ncbi:MAG: hypothetical protein WCV72_04300 [Patescibacteria group bacterium]
MKKQTIWLVLFLLVFGAIRTSSAFADVVVFYCNGMFVPTEEKADDARAAIQKAVGTTFNGQVINYKVAYNQNEGALSLVEVAEQKSIEVWPEFFDWISGVVEAPDWFWAAAETLFTSASLQAWVSDKDLWEHVTKYRAEIDAGNKVLLVAHSQGNFYANEAHFLINDPDNLKVVSVANPADYVAGCGPYTTLYDDHVINSVRRAFGALPGNMENTKSYERLNHDFLLSYFQGDRSGPKIIKDIKRQIAVCYAPVSSIDSLWIMWESAVLGGIPDEINLSWAAVPGAASYNIYIDSGIWLLAAQTTETSVKLVYSGYPRISISAVTADGEEGLKTEYAISWQDERIILD